MGILDIHVCVLYTYTFSDEMLFSLMLFHTHPKYNIIFYVRNAFNGNGATRVRLNAKGGK